MTSPRKNATAECSRGAQLLLLPPARALPRPSLQRLHVLTTKVVSRPFVLQCHENAVVVFAGRSIGQVGNNPGQGRAAIRNMHRLLRGSFTNLSVAISQPEMSKHESVLARDLRHTKVPGCPWVDSGLVNVWSAGGRGEDTKPHRRQLTRTTCCIRLPEA